LSERPLRQTASVDEPGLVGARWWQDSVVDPVGRRHAILTMLAVGGTIALGGVVVEACGLTTTSSRQNSLALQRKYGWSFGAETDDLVFNGVSTEPFDPARLTHMVADLAPRVPLDRPFYVQTLFESPTALPQSPPDEPTASLASTLRPISTSSMQDAFQTAQAKAQMLAAVPGVALAVDLNGPESVAFAAGASALFDPVFLFDNWPHPRGVVPAHLTLAAAAYYQPMLAQAAQSGPRDSPPMFVLDRQRLNTYVDDAQKFDNRWVARMPGVTALKSLGVKRLIYISSGGITEADDLNDDFVAYVAGGVAITILVLSDIEASILTADYIPKPRHTQFSSGIAAGGRPTPSDFGSVPVLLGLGGAMLGVAWARSGTWNRSGGSFWSSHWSWHSGGWHRMHFHSSGFG
jgi:hypothetical protein